MNRPKTLAALMLVIMSTAATVSFAAEGPLSVSQLVDLAIETNPQIHSARARLESARHSILQNYAPVDPTFTYVNSDSTGGLSNAALHSHQLLQPFQFPGKALLQADQAKRNAEIARLTMEAAIRDLRAATETAYYQFVLDSGLFDVNAENVANLKQVLGVTQIAYTANQVTQTDFISAEFDLTQAQLLQLQYETGRANDETAINQLLYRDPGSPLDLDRTLKLDTLKMPLGSAIDAATKARQEILETALTERNADTALELAKLEYAPDYTIGYTFDYYLIASFAPTFQRTQAHTYSIGFNMPIFSWLKQREDVTRARYDLEAARSDLKSIRSQTAASVTQLYRTAQLAYQNAVTYRDTLIPLARQDFQVALVAYQSGKIDFVTLSSALRRSYDAHVGYLTAANQFLAGKVALEQAIGAPLPQ